MKGMTVAGITHLETTSAKDIMNQLRKGNSNRTVEPTAANKVSSRSHAVLQIVIEQREKTANTEQEVKVEVWLLRAVEGDCWSGNV